MKMKKYALLKERTDSKLRYAQLYLDELKNPKTSGSDSEKAHQESFLFHLNGVSDAFLAEINEIYGLGIKAKNLSIKSLKAAKSNSKKPIEEAKKLSKLMDKKNWLSELKSFNPHLVPKSKNGKKTKSKDKAETANLMDQISQIPANPVLEKFEEWQAKMSKLILELRESAIHASEKASKK
ncbi:hypothetical protein P872_19175 [Rhodonellum psychrophilum GCM71 = DSM 17998]|uniref:Uncharacterized protein n=2 Tax=Rhodonellum TaxID=336827 RepID=U5BV76_9BACT|nr:MULTISPECIES: DUF6586 family protein [Rhodonellum]ERM81778.1 hypothetical protein P872_19175 [Rhodonellum psychrophilum GCM71 = DSM 17998]SDZ47878.1 hypothetical protein SAMN05444412_11683 [Rhodonellum ikkaensis]